MACKEKRVSGPGSPGSRQPEREYLVMICKFGSSIMISGDRFRSLLRPMKEIQHYCSCVAKGTTDSAIEIGGLIPVNTEMLSAILVNAYSHHA